MSALWSAFTRRHLLMGVSALAGLLGLGVIGANRRALFSAPPEAPGSNEGSLVTVAPTSGGKTAIRPIRINVPDQSIEDLRRRLEATRWPEKEPVADQSQGVQLATMQALARYWGTGYDFRRGSRPG